MIKVYLYRNQSTLSIEIETMLRRKLEEAQLEVMTRVDGDNIPDYIITIGGDGTLLAAVHMFEYLIEQVRFIGIHTGHLGFYADWQRDELDELVTQLKVENDEYVSYPLLAAKVEYEDGKIERYLAINELSIRTNAGTMVCDVSIQDQFFEVFRGDGLCIATPSGSTGLNKSLGGAVVHPSLDVLQLTEMASLNNRVYRTLSAPIIIGSDEWFTLAPHKGRDLILMVDHLTFSAQAIKKIRAGIAPVRLRFAALRHTHFWDRVENSFIGHKQLKRKEEK